LSNKLAIEGGIPIRLTNKLALAKPFIGEEEIEAVLNVLRSGILTNATGSGPKVAELEKKYARYNGVKHAVACCNGTAALHVALTALGIKPRDEVITTSFSFIASSNAVLFLGAIPVFADIDPLTYTINPDEIETKITKKTKAIIPVHLFGCPAEMDQIKEIANKHDLYIIEDIAQAHGARYKGKMVGNFGDIGCYSFYATKNIHAGGEGGLIVTNNEEVANRCKMMVAQGQSEKYEHDLFGFNYRMMEMSAAIALAQFNRLEYFNKKRKWNAKLLDEILQSLRGINEPYKPEYADHVYHLYAAKIPEDSNWARDKVVAALNAEGIGAANIYSIPIYNQPLYRKINDPKICWAANICVYPDYSKIRLPITEKICQQLLLLPIHPSLTEKDIEDIGNALRKIFSST